MESITLEVRPRLHSLNAFISLSTNADTSTVKVTLSEDIIKIKVEDRIYNLPLNNMKLAPASLSSLRITKRWITFRIQTQEKTPYGGFGFEILNAEEKNNGFLIISNKIQLPPKNTDCKLHCSCCENEITKSVQFERILQLPSSGCDVQEWFCCKHNHDESESFSLSPKDSDLFYSANYFVLNKCVFVESLKYQDSLIHCNRCLSILGSTNGTDLKSLKIWNCCVKQRILNERNLIKGIPSTLDDFLLTIRHVAEFVIGEKILLEAQDVNSIHYILLRPMETKLNLFTEDKSNSESGMIDLKSSFISKVLYKVGESKKTTRFDDPDVIYCEVALPSILAGMDQLVASTARFSPVYRKAEDFYFGYLPM